MATLKQLKAFIAVAEYKKMSEAARHLYISQPTVSQIISDLEAEYSTLLFERSPKHLRITPAGMLLLNSAREIVTIHENLEQSMRNINALRPLRVGATVTIGNSMMGSLISELIKKYPDIDASVCVDNTRHIEHLMIQNELDVALVEGIITRKEIITEPAIEDSLCLICGKGHPFAKRTSVSVRELQNQDFIMREKGSGTRAIFENIMHVRHIPFHIKWECSSSTAITDAVRHSLGLGVLSERSVSEEIKTGQIFTCPVNEVSMKRYFYLCRSQYHPITTQMQDFMNLVKALHLSCFFNN